MGKRANGEGCIRKRKNKDGKIIGWEARLTIDGKPRSFYGQTQDDVKEKLEKAKGEVRSNSFIEPSAMTVSDWLKTWIDTFTTDIKDSTRNEYRKIIVQRIIPRLGNRPLQKLTQEDVQRFVNELFKSGRVSGKKNGETSTGLSARSVEFTHTILCAALSQAESLGYIHKNPAIKKQRSKSGVTLPTVIKKDVEIFSGDTLNAFEIAVQEHENKALFLTLLYTGLRRGECLALTWSDIIPAIDGSGRITINKQLQKERIKGGKLQLVPYTKNNKVRTIPADNDLIKLLQEHKDEQAQKQQKAGELWENNNFIFCNNIGGMLFPDVITKQFKRFLENQGLPVTKLHALRHTAATEMLQAGDNPKDVQNTLGHHSAGYTMDTYTQVTEQALQASALRRAAYRESRRALSGTMQA